MIHNAANHSARPPTPCDVAERTDPCAEERLSALMAGYQSADPDAVRLLVECLSPRLARYFRRRLGDDLFVEDAVQECWVRIHRSRHAYRPGGRLMPWVYAIASRTAIDRRRRQERTEWLEEGLGDDELEGLRSRRGLSPEMRIDLRRGLEGLSARERQALYLARVEGLTLQDVSVTTGASLDAVKQRIHRAYVKLRSTLGAPS
ncbi:MAG: RNA polymerase sigma factor [Pirellulales bacterium]|nr:RNA polymerase sigma factor [Pirellulales bacterium]